MSGAEGEKEEAAIFLEHARCEPGRPAIFARQTAGEMEDGVGRVEPKIRELLPQGIGCGGRWYLAGMAGAALWFPAVLVTSLNGLWSHIS
jgi:hypothetical protein